MEFRKAASYMVQNKSMSDHEAVENEVLLKTKPCIKRKFLEELERFR